MRFDSLRLADLRTKIGKAPIVIALAAIALLAVTWIPGAILDRTAPEPALTHQLTGTPATGSSAVATPRAADRGDPFDGPGAAIDITLKLLVVLALVYLALSALRKYSLGAGLGRGGRSVQVLECTNLAANRSLYVVNVEGKRLLIGVTASSMSTLAELEPTADSGVRTADEREITPVSEHLR